MRSSSRWALVVVLLLVPGTAHGYRLGDMNCDGAVDFFDIDPFVMAVTDAETFESTYECPLVNGDCNNDGQVDFFDIDAFVDILTGAGVDYDDSGCLPGPPDSWCFPDEFEFTVEPSTLHVLHYDAEYNCCRDEIVVYVEVGADWIGLVEDEILTVPCWCMCCFNVESTVADLVPGTYTVEYCWYDEGVGDDCVTTVVEIP